MAIIDRTSKRISSWAADILHLENERQEIIEYGAMNLLHNVISLALLILFGLIFGSLHEIVLISFASALLRKFTGGAHATSPNRCTIITVIILGGLSLISKYFIVFNARLQIIIFQIAASVIIFYVLYRRAPVDNPNKRITNENFRIKLRKRAFFFVALISTIMFCISGFLNDSWISKSILCIYVGFIWQTFCITKLGILFIEKIDTAFTHIFEKGGS